MCHYFLPVKFTFNTYLSLEMRGPASHLNYTNANDSQMSIQLLSLLLPSSTITTLWTRRNFKIFPENYCSFLWELWQSLHLKLAFLITWLTVRVTVWAVAPVNNLKNEQCITFVRVGHKFVLCTTRLLTVVEYSYIQ